MKLNKIFLGIFIISISLANIYWIFKMRKFIERITYLSSHIIQIEDSIKSYNYSSELQFAISSNIVDMNSNVKDEKGQLTKLSLIHKANQNLLIIRYGEISCKSCLNEYVKKLIEIFNDSLITHKTVFLARYSNQHDLTQFKRIHRINSYIYSMDNILTPIDSLNIPYFFILKNNGEIKSPYVPLLSNEELTIKYFNIIKKELLN